MQGSVSLAESATRRSIFRETPKPLALLHETISVMDAGRFPEGQTEIPFEAEVKGIDGMVRGGMGMGLGSGVPSSKHQHLVQ